MGLPAFVQAPPPAVGKADEAEVDGGFGRACPTALRPCLLFDLEADPNERDNLAALRPDKVRELVLASARADACKCGEQR